MNNNNTITLPAYYSFLDAEAIQAYLPFDNKNFRFRSIDRLQTGYGQWLLTADIAVGDENRILKAKTNDSMMIDDWNDEGEVREAAIAKALAIVLSANEDHLEDMALDSEAD